MEVLKGIARFEQIAVDDLLDVVRSIKGRDAQNVFVEPPGIGVDRLLAWSVSDLRSAKGAGNDDDRDRCAANALLNGRRALACLVDWYLTRDCFSLCEDAPLPTKKKAELLLSRGLLDDITSGAFSRAIQERDRVEHQFLAPNVEQAEDFVELMRRTIQGIRADSDPSEGPFLFGMIPHSISGNAHGHFARFYGWQKPCLLLCSFDPRPWLGAILPQSANTAIVRRAFFDEVPTRLLLEVLQTAEQTFGRAESTVSSALWKLVLAECGLLQG